MNRYTIQDNVKAVGGYLIMAFFLTLLAYIWSGPILGDLLLKALATEVLLIIICVIADQALDLE